jgi:6-phosphogluconolactonase
MSVSDMCDQDDKFIKSFAETNLLKSYISEHIARRSVEAIAQHGAFVIALSGGSMPKLLSDLAERTDIQWEAIYILFADERCM